THPLDLLRAVALSPDFFGFFLWTAQLSECNMTLLHISLSSGDCAMTHLGERLRGVRLWSCAVPLLGLLVGIVLVGDKGDVTAAEKDAKDLPADIARVPQDAFFVFTCRLAELWTSPAAKSLRENLAKKFPEINKQAEEQMAHELGIGASECERVT